MCWKFFCVMAEGLLEIARGCSDGLDLREYVGAPGCVLLPGPRAAVTCPPSGQRSACGALQRGAVQCRAVHGMTRAFSLGLSEPKGTAVVFSSFGKSGTAAGAGRPTVDGLIVNW